MKNIRYIVFAVLCSILGSCSLQEKSYTEIEMGSYMKNATEAENVLLGVYRNMTEEGMYRYHLSMLFALPTDIAKCDGSDLNNYRIVAANAYSSVQNEVEVTWKALNKGIYEANSFIRELALKVETFESQADRNLAAVLMGEARALRALYYFELVRWYGNVTLITDPMFAYKVPLQEMVQDEPVKIYEQIEKDLKYAAEVLPYATDDNVRSDNSFRFSKGAALGLLTKVYATWAGYPLLDESKWEDAAATAKVLVESGKHSLLTEGTDGDSGYEQLWWNTCNGIWDPRESLIEVSFYSPSATAQGAALGRIGKWNGVLADNIKGVRNSGQYRVVPTFMVDWPNRAEDLRSTLSVANYRYRDESKTRYDLRSSNSNGNMPFDPNQFEAMFQPEPDTKIQDQYVKNLTPAKWDTEKYVKDANYLVEQNLSNINWYVLRYADVLLLYAEALNEINEGPTTLAYELVNMVRRRGFGYPINAVNNVSDLTAGLGYEEFRQAIRNERAYELAFEGHRRQDLVRWGIYYESVMKTAQDLEDFKDGASSVYVAAQHTKKGKHELLPIPQRDLFLMPKYKQNPKW